MILFVYMYVDIDLEVKDRNDFNPDFISTVIWSQQVLESVTVARNSVNWLNI